jgi:putative membrane protein
MHTRLMLLLHPGAVLPQDVWQAWSFDPLITLGLIGALLLYARGLQRLWAHAGMGRGVRHWQAWCFAGGMLTLVAAMISPLHALGGTLFSAHMTQHVLLMGLAAPLLVLGAPLTAALWALPRRARRRTAMLMNSPAVRGSWRALTLPASAWLLHAAAIWIWHVPALYTATLSSELVHYLQHAAFFGTALLFWYALRDRATHGLAILYLFTTAVHSSLLGALLAFSPGVFYAPYAATAPVWGMSGLEDQQLGGFIMWVPAGLVYFVAALALLASWLHRSEQRARLADAVRLVPRASVVLGIILLAGCGRGEQQGRGGVAGGDAERGQAALRRYSCGSCHTIRGVRGADGRIGPSLNNIRAQVYIAGHLPNTPENVMAWIMAPQAYRSPTAMPDMGVTEEDARDIVAYLYGLRR